MKYNSPATRIPKREAKPIRFIDLFCGIGGFRFAMESVAFFWEI